MNVDVCIATNEDDLSVNYGLFNLREERELARSSFKYIATDICEIQNNYIRLGFHLAECQNMKYYEDFGYDNMAEFVEKNFGLEKSALSRCLNVFYRFAAVQGGTRMMYLNDKFKEYSYSQLCEMVSMLDSQVSQIKPDMTVKQIREFKKQFKKKNNDSVATSQLNKDECVETEENSIPYESFDDEKFINELLTQIKEFVFCNAPDDIVSSALSGKRFSFESNDAVYNVQFSKTKKKAGG